MFKSNWNLGNSLNVPVVDPISLNHNVVQDSSTIDYPKTETYLLFINTEKKY